VYSQLSSRRAEALFGYAAERGQLGRAPHFNAPSKFLNRSEATPVLRQLLALSALPLAGVEATFAVDSTGFRTTNFGSYLNAKHGVKREHEWLKAHLVTGVKTNIVASATITDSQGKGTADTTQFPPLMEALLEGGFAPSVVTADGAYASRTNMDLLQALGVEPLIPFNDRVKPRALGSSAWRKAVLYFQLHRDEFRQRYHQRSNVESTISAIKRKLGESVRSKNRVAQENELLCKFIAYNLTVLIHEMFEHGVEPSFIGLRAIEAKENVEAAPSQ
jgi:transposase